MDEHRSRGCQARRRAEGGRGGFMPVALGRQQALCDALDSRHFSVVSVVFISSNDKRVGGFMSARAIAGVGGCAMPPCPMTPTVTVERAASSPGGCLLFSSLSSGDPLFRRKASA